MGFLMERLSGVATENQDGRGAAEDRDLELVRDGRGRMVDAKTGVIFFAPVEVEDEGGDVE